MQTVLPVPAAWQKGSTTDAHTEQFHFLMQGNTQSVFTWLYNKYWEPLLHYAANYIRDRDTCEELVQKLFIHLFVTGRKLNINASVSSYLYVSLRNRIYNHFRDQAVYKRHTSKAGMDHQWWHNNVDQAIGLMELQKEIHKVLDRLPAKYREVYLLHERDMFPVKQIASMLDRPHDTVEKQLRRALNLLREHLLHKQPLT
jgi:RNA polymerase sigma factor (sigma-70 family)